MNPFSLQTIVALAEVITGGSASTSGSPIGHYRSGSRIGAFFQGLNLDFQVGSSSRLPATLDYLKYLNNEQPETIVKVIEAVADPRDYLEEPEKLTRVVEYLNKRLSYDHFELRSNGPLYKLFPIATNIPVTESLSKLIDKLDYESVKQDFARALDQSESDPEDAVTSACSTVESVCKCILDEMQIPYPSKQDIGGLAREVSKHLNLSPGRTDISPEIETDVKQVLSGLVSVTGGIGALRTHGGDAHGRGKERTPIDSRIARLAIHAASTISLFFIETWNKLKDKP
jgi:hypothetical protein